MSKQLTKEQRYVISALLKRKVSLSEIAKETGRHISTIYREINRNSCKNGHYSPALAQEMAMERRERIVTNSALKPGVLKQALDLLREEQWSPRQISGALALKGIAISHERIYQAIRADKTGELTSHTRHGMKHRKRHKSGRAGVKNIPNRISIHDRPAEADGKRFGDWEMDLIVDPLQNAIVTLTERSTNFILLEKLPEGKKAVPLAKTVVRMLFAWRQGVKTIATTEVYNDKYLLENKNHATNRKNPKKNTTFVFNKRSVTYPREYLINQHIEYDSGHSTKGLKKAVYT